MKYLTRTIWVLSLVSLFTDMASEMLYPVMPFYLKSIGFSIVLIGVLEGIAEAVAGLSKGYFGKWSDIIHRRLPFVRLGYSFSALSKPMMAVFTYPAWIFFARTIDRFGKGLRTGPRDAILSDESNVKNKGKVFGFHRAMDTFGAVVGPLFAMIFLLKNPGNYRTLFYIAFLPGLFAVAFTFFIREKKIKRTEAKPPAFASFYSYWKESPPMYKKVAGGLLLFMLFNSSDVFLLLRVRELGVPDTTVIAIYIFYNLVYASTSFPAGILADRIGLKRMLIAGLTLFAIVYGGMSLVKSMQGAIAMFFLYGIYAAATEGISKALISNVVNKDQTASALGTFAGFQSISLLFASALTGFVWYHAGSALAFMLSASVSALVAIYFSVITIRTQPH